MVKTIDNLCDSCTNSGCEFQSGIVRTKCAFYMPPHIEPDNCGNCVVMQPTVRLIDADVLREEVNSWGMNDYEPSDFTDVIDDAPTIEAIPKSDYEEQIKINNKLVKDNKQLKAYITMMQIDYKARLKADLVAMLTELQLEIEECEDCGRAFHLGLQMASKIIQKKINKLRGDKDAKIQYTTS